MGWLKISIVSDYQPSHSISTNKKEHLIMQFSYLKVIMKIFDNFNFLQLSTRSDGNPSVAL